MPTYGQIKRQIDLNPFAILMLRNELKALPSIIQEEEYIDASVHGYWNNRHVLLLATTKRILLVDSDQYGDVEVVEFPYDRTVTVRCPTPDSVVFGTNERKVRVDNTIEEYIDAFYKVVNARLEGKEPQIYRERDIYSKNAEAEQEEYSEQNQPEYTSNPFHVLLKGLDGITKMINPDVKVNQSENA